MKSVLILNSLKYNFIIHFSEHCINPVNAQKSQKINAFQDGLIGSSDTKTLISTVF